MTIWEDAALLAPAIDDAFAFEGTARLSDPLVQTRSVHFIGVIGRDLGGDAGEDTLDGRVTAGLPCLRLFEVAEQAREELQVTAAGPFFAPLRREVGEGGAADRVALDTDINEAGRRADRRDDGARPES